MTLIGAVLAYFFLEGTVRIVVVVALLLSDVVEIAIWLRWRQRRAMTGAEGMVGRTGVAISDLGPQGQVNVMGQIWNATSEEHIPVGEKVEVTGTEGLRLHVARR